MLPYSEMDLRVREERRRNLLREAAAERRIQEIRKQKRSAAVLRVSTSAAKIIAGKTESPPWWARFCCGMGKRLESAGRSLQILGEKAVIGRSG